jgi:hypothetical protein
MNLSLSKNKEPLKNNGGPFSPSIIKQILKEIDTLSDDLLSIDALFFLCSCLCAYWALRMRSIRLMHFVERMADGTFIMGLILMVTVCGIITCTII